MFISRNHSEITWRSSRFPKIYKVKGPQTGLRSAWQRLPISLKKSNILLLIFDKRIKSVKYYVLKLRLCSRLTSRQQWTCWIGCSGSSSHSGPSGRRPGPPELRRTMKECQTQTKEYQSGLTFFRLRKDSVWLMRVCSTRIGCFSAKMHIFIGAWFTAAENIEESITAKTQSSQGLRAFVQLFWPIANVHGRTPVVRRYVLF